MMAKKAIQGDRLKVLEKKVGVLDQHLRDHIALADNRDDAMVALLRAIERRLGDLEGKVSDIAGQVSEHLSPDPAKWPVLEQFNQMAKAVNIMAAYMGAIDTHKQELINLTSGRIGTLTEQPSHMRVRLRRLESNGREGPVSIGDKIHD